MMTKFETPAAAAMRANTRRGQSRLGLCRMAASLITAMAAIQTLPARGEPLSVASFAMSAAAPDAATVRAGEPARAKHAPSPVDDNTAPRSVAADHQLKFFGFVEFDWDSPGAGGVPGFGPLPDSPSQVVLADAGK